MKRTIITIILTLTFAAFAIHAVGQTALKGAGVIESTSGGFKFPDGSIQTTAASASQMRSYYLSNDYFMGSEVIGACAAGYHNANIWEIWHFSSLAYNSDLGITSADSPYGPTSDWLGWVALGTVSSTADNCEAWYSSNSNHQALTASLNATRILLGSNYEIWTIDHRSCNESIPVWCVSDFVQ